MKSKIIKSERLYDGFVKLRKDTIKHETYSGSEIEIVREIIEHSDTVSGIVFNTETQEIYLVEQYRATVDDWVEEAVAGIVDLYETPLEAFEREVLEELGIKLNFIRNLPSHTHGSIGSKTGRSYNFFARTTEEPSEFAGENGQEDIKTIKIPLEDFEYKISIGGVIDPKILIPYLYVKVYEPHLLR
jgi:ADP-ribose pyrophosphatase